MLYLLGEFCLLLVIFDNCLKPDQAPLLVGPDLDLLDTLIVYLKIFFFKKKVNFEKKQQQTAKKHAKLPCMQRGNPLPHRDAF